MKIHPPALSYRPARPADFANFWKATLIAQRELPLQARLTRRDYLIAQIEVYDVRFKGFGGAELAGIYLLPKQRSKRLPVVLQSHGYTWHKGEPLNHLHWIMLGMAVLAVDVRGQAGDSADNQGYPGGHAAGYMTQGILDPAAYYYRSVYADTLRCVDFLCSRPEVDPQRILANGESQGGGLALATACLDPRVSLCGADNPSLIDFPSRLKLGATGSTEELRSYLRIYPERGSQVLRTLAYVDLLNHLPSLRCPSFWSASLNDPVCPAKTVERGYDLVKGKNKEIRFYRDMGHDIHPSQLGHKLAWVAGHFGL